MKSSTSQKVPKGYKQTDIGAIPSDWNVKTVGECATKVGSGITPTGGEKVYKYEGRPFLRSQNIGWGKLELDDIAYIDDLTHEAFIRTEIELEDVLLNITGASIGRSAVADTRVIGGNVNQHVCIIRTAKNYLNPRLLNYLLLSKNGQALIDSYQAGGNRQGLNFRQIKSFLFPLPPTKTEQTAIVAALSDTDELIESLEKLIAKKRAIKQGAIQELLTGKRRLPGFKRNWEKKQLVDIADIKKGHGLSKGKLDESGKYSCILYGELFTTYTEEIVKVQSKTNSDEGIMSKRGDVLLPGSTTTKGIDLAKASVLHIGGIQLGGDINIIRQLNNSYNPTFLAYCLTHIYKNDIAQKTKGITIHHLHATDLYDLQISMPKYGEQTFIVHVLSDMDNEIEHLKRKLLKFRQIKQGMMQVLLTGKIRLI